MRLMLVGTGPDRLSKSCLRAIVSGCITALALFCSTVCFAEGLPGELKSPPVVAQPNIVLIVLDDLDLFDVGVYGSPDIQTPAIDRLATQGMRFDRFYSAAPVCSPSRTAMLTGEYPAHFGVKRAILDRSWRGIPSQAPTLAEVLSEMGYRTGHFGKWHVGNKKSEFLPTNMGFDVSARLITDAGLNYRNFTLSQNDQELVTYDSGEFLTDELTDQALRFIDQRVPASKIQPFFVNLWYLAPHRPLDQLPEDYDNSETDYCLRKQRDDDSCDSLRGNLAALITHADRQIARVFAKIDASPELRDNTMIVVVSDNGGTKKTHNTRILPTRPISGFKGSMGEGALRVPMIIRWPGRVRAASVEQAMLTGIDLFPTLADIAGADISALDVPGKSFRELLTRDGENSFRLTSDLLNRKAHKRLMVWEGKADNDRFTNASGVYNTYAVVDDPYKLVFSPARNVEDPDQTYLYNLDEDPLERANLLGAGRNASWWSRALTWAGLGDANSDPKYSHLAARLQSQYQRWRGTHGDIPYELVLGEGAVKQDRDLLEFSGGYATIARDTRFDFNDGDFTFSAVVEPLAMNKVGVIATKVGSWELRQELEELVLVVLDGKTKAQLRLSAPWGGDGAKRVTFTVFGWRDSASDVKLYVDGLRVAESSAVNGVDRVRSQDEPGKPMIYLGSDAIGAEPFIGTMTMPKMSTLSHYPYEVFLDHAAH